MSRNGSLLAIGGVPVNVVTPSVADENAVRFFKLFDEGLAFHTSNSTDCRSAPGGAGTRSCVTITS